MAMTAFVDVNLFLSFYGWDVRCVETVQARRLTEYAADAMSKEETGLTRLLANLRGLDATDPRDRVFAVLGMSNERNEEGFGADFTRAT